MTSLSHTPVLTVAHLAPHDGNNFSEPRNCEESKNANYSTVTDREPFSSVVNAVSIEMLFSLLLLANRFFVTHFQPFFHFDSLQFRFPPHASHCLFALFIVRTSISLRENDPRL